MVSPPPIIGIDFDNTLVCYDVLFHRIAREQNLIDDTIPVNKTAVRDYLRSIGREPAWTEMQGVVYGTRIIEAEPFPGAIDFLTQAGRRGWTLHIVSHKTRAPILGAALDLHAAARRWLETYGVFGPTVALPRENVWLELTKQEKLRRIETLGCQVFIDDLPEFLLDPAFPPQTRRFLFDPNRIAAPGVAAAAALETVFSWSEMLPRVAHVLAH